MHSMVHTPDGLPMDLYPLLIRGKQHFGIHEPYCFMTCLVVIVIAIQAYCAFMIATVAHKLVKVAPHEVEICNAT